jgi:hypothetical protein
VDTILKVILGIAAAWFAYAATAGLRRTRVWTPVTTIGVYLTLFGGTTYALISVEGYYTAKLMNDSPSETTLLIAGLIIIAFVVLFALDLLGKVDVMGQIQRAIAGASGGDSSAGKGPTPSNF